MSQVHRAPAIAPLAAALTGLSLPEAERLALLRLTYWPDPEAWTDEEIALDIQWAPTWKPCRLRSRDAREAEGMEQLRLEGAC